MSCWGYGPAFGSLDAFLNEQRDLGTKWAPRYIRLIEELPRTATSKVVKRPLRAEAWHTADPLYLRQTNSFTYEPIPR